MITLRPAAERGRTTLDWLESFHSFSFGEYRDRDHMGFRSLRVINDDVIAPGAGFATHPHSDMEIVSYVVSGALEHRDSTGGSGVIRPGDVQAMSAGSGLTHSEFNHSKTEPVRLLQIWLRPSERALPPRFADRSFDPAQRTDRLQLIVSPDGADGSLSINQDARIYASRPAPGSRLSFTLAPDRAAWVQVVSGRLDLNGITLTQGDGAAVENEVSLAIAAAEQAELLLFDLA